MIDYHKEIVKALSNILPTHYEMALTSDTKTPCISYMETNNYTLTEPLGAGVEYSRLGFQIKVWANDIATIQRYAPNVDLAMRVLGFKRTSSGELYDHNSTMIQKILNYEALAIEQY
jgi:hypothetical protein